MTTGVITDRQRDFPRWYSDVVAKAELAENGPARGTMVIRPYGYAIWELMQADMDARIKAAGARNAYFPLLIPESYLRAEAEHVEGFSPELAVVTHAGGKELEEPLVVRPTSETVIGEYLARWAQSYRDLPLLLNQWANVVRWELRPRLLLRTTEFLWQEGHTAHATAAEATAYAQKIQTEVYARHLAEALAIPAVLGIKTERERFAGAVNTLTLEAMMGDHKALQLGTSHELGQNFARAFDIRYLTPAGVHEHAWTTSWGSSTRMLGGVIMCHGDDAGLRLPPRIAPVQALITVVKDGDQVSPAAERLRSELQAAGVRVEVDDRVDVPFGRRAVDAELQGIPVRVELGPRDVADASVVLARRVTRSKTTVPLDGVVPAVVDALAADHDLLYGEALEHRRSATSRVRSIAEAIDACAAGWATIGWADLGVEGEAELAQHAITVRCLTRADGSVPESSDEPDVVAVLARSY